VRAARRVSASPQQSTTPPTQVASAVAAARRRRSPAPPLIRKQTGVTHALIVVVAAAAERAHLTRHGAPRPVSQGAAAYRDSLHTPNIEITSTRQIFRRTSGSAVRNLRSASGASRRRDTTAPVGSTSLSTSKLKSANRDSNQNIEIVCTPRPRELVRIRNGVHIPAPNRATTRGIRAFRALAGWTRLGPGHTSRPETRKGRPWLNSPALHVLGMLSTRLFISFLQPRGK
jgi:hypothetical protein